MFYFDNAATTFPKPQCVIDAVNDCTKNFCVNSGRGQYSLSSKANKIINETRNKIRNLFHCNNDFECVFTDSATTAINTILSGIDLNGNIYTTPFEHNAVLRTLYSISNCEKVSHGFGKSNDFPRDNTKIISNYELEFDTSSFSYDLQKIESQFTKNLPSFLIMSHASNTFGFVAPIKEISRLAKKINPKCVVILDCSQTAGLLDIDFSENLYDYAVFAGHKTLYATFGVAGFVMRKSIPLKTFIFGGTGIESANPKMPSESPEKYEAGSHNIIAISSLNASLDEIEKYGREDLLIEEQKKRERLLQILQKFSNIKIIDSENPNKENRVGIISCTFDNYSPDEIGSILNDKEIAVRTGLHCAPNGHKLLGTFPSGTVRFSLGRFTSEEDFSGLERALEWIGENG